MNRIKSRRFNIEVTEFPTYMIFDRGGQLISSSTPHPSNIDLVESQLLNLIK
jgi:hypothetical protein